MKTRIVCIGMVGLIMATSCGGKEIPAEKHLTWVIDLTEDSMTIASELEGHDIQRILHVGADNAQGAVVRFRVVGDTRYTQTYQEIIPSVAPRDLNVYQRTKHLKQFHATLDNRVTEIQQNMREQKQSLVFQQLFTALNELAIAETSSKTLIVASDLGHNERGFFSVFNKKDMVLLEKHPEFLAKKLEESYPIHHSLNGIQVYFVHRSSTTDDNTFHRMAHFLSEYLLTKGVKEIHTVSSLHDIQPM